ncbi:MAG: PAS domain-containing protein, partial [Spirochaetales bacterium]|nr:PAS domain-containing protein [Spirochaetales bacterium]
MMMMMITSFSSLIVSVIYIHFGIYAINQNKSGLIHKLFFSVAITSAFWSFCTALFHCVQNKDIAINIYLVSLLGPFFLPAVVTHTVFAISQRNILRKHRWLPSVLYLLSCISVIGLFIPEAIVLDLIITPSGWIIELNKSSFFVWFYVGLFTSINIINIIVLYRWKMALASIEKRNQALIILFTFLLSIVLIYTEEIFCMFIKIQFFPSLSHVATLLWLSGVLFVIKKYNFIIISPEKAVHEILFNMMDILLLTDEKGEITRVNQQLTQLLGCSEWDLVNKPVADLFEEGLNLTNVKTLTQCRKNIITKKEESIPVLLRISP